jgi:hypothetical protein
VVGLLAGFVNEHGLLRGALAGAVTGALVSVELASSLLRIWTRIGCPMDARIKRTVCGIPPSTKLLTKSE